MTRASHVGDRPVPHSLSALLSPTCAPHARLLKHWERRIVSLLALVRHPRARSLLPSRASTLASFSARLPASCSLLFSHASSLAFFSLRTDLQFFLFLRPVSAGVEFPQAHPAPLAHRYHDNPCARKRAGLSARERNMCERVCHKEKKLPIREGLYPLPFSTHHI